MTVAGVDYGSRRVAVAIPHKGVAAALSLHRTAPFPACISVLADYVVSHLSGSGVTHVAIEAPVQGASRNVRTGMSLAMVCGSLVSACIKGGYQVLLVEPATWKKEVCGHGGCDKEAVSEWLRSSSPELHAAAAADQDRVDAICIGLYAQSVVG